MGDTDVHRNELTGLVRIGSTDQFAHRISKQPTHICDEPVVIGCSDEPTNYGSFLFRAMPKILAARHLDPAHKFLEPLKCNSFRELCLLAGLSEDRLIAHDDRAIYKLRKAYLPTIRNPQAFLDEPTLGLFSRIAERFEAMLELGLIGELRQLRSRFALDPNLPSMRCVGYRQTWDYLDGKLTLAQLRETGIAATRQLAKRQLTWLRPMEDVARFDCLSADASAKIVDHFRRALKSAHL
jgi:hypothetical protein